MFKPKFICLKIFSIIFLISFFATHVEASVLGVYPSASSANVGNIVPVKVLVSTKGQTINNVEGIISYSTDLLEVTSLSKNGSIFSLWFDDPSFSNNSGEVLFNGGLPSPGYSGNSGEVITILFRTKKPGIASLVLKNSSVRANDGLGTNVLESTVNNTITIGQGDVETVRYVPEVQETVSDSKVPSKPNVISPSHPDSNLWYQNKSVTFNWKTPANVDYVETLFNNKPDSEPSVSYDSSVTERTISGVSDGTYYFHIRYINDFGSSPTVHYKVKIDTTPPEKFTASIDDFDYRNQINLNAKDLMSGIDYYMLTIDNQYPFRVTVADLDRNGNYILPVQNKGKHKIKIVAYDKAQNYTESNNVFDSGSITAPKLKVENSQIVRGDSLAISGTSDYPDTNVNIYVNSTNRDSKIYVVRSDKNGDFKIKTDGIKNSGSVSVSAQMIFSSQVKGSMSDILTIDVKDSLVINASKSVIYTMSFVIPALVSVILAVLIIYIGWHKFFGLKKRIKTEIRSVQLAVHKEMKEFKKELSVQLEHLEDIKRNRSLNQKEEKIFNELKRNIDRIDRIIEKKIAEIK